MSSPRLRSLPAVPALSAVLAAALAAAPLAACGDDVELLVPPERTVAPSPTAGVDSAALKALLVEHWDLEVEFDPFSATYYGDHRRDAELPPVGHDAIGALRARRLALLARVTALPPGALSARDRLTHAVLVERLTAAAGLDVCDYERWVVSPRDNAVRHLDQIGDYHPLLSAEDAASYLARVAAMPAAIDAIGDELAAGAAAGKVGGRQAMQGMISLIHSWASRPADSWPMVQAIHAGYLERGERERLVGDVTAVITGQLVPAYRRLGPRLEALLPAARATEGLAGLPGGAACYAAEIRRHTTLPMTAAELHALGLSEVARIEAAITTLGRQLYGVDTLAAVQSRLNADAGQRFTSEAEILTWVEGIIGRARERVAPLFARFPETPLEVVPYPAEAGQIAASYWSSPDGSQPARYFLVTQPPNGQARWAMESTTYHEAIPGHHLQIGRAAELPDLPALRLLFNDTAYVEGWGLYAETLAGEIDLYTDGAARIGRLANEALRACRLVLDTGLHDLGWTRAQAIAFMEQHSLFAGAFVASEVERYILWPGQALAYKVGELELLRLRAEVRARDGAAFSLRDFHEAVLDGGSLPLPALAGKLLGDVSAARTPRGAELARHGGGWEKPGAGAR